jgi:uncharacterized protein YbaR (Trm112 family)
LHHSLNGLVRAKCAVFSPRDDLPSRAVAPERRRLIQCLFTHSKANNSSAEIIMAIPKYALDILVCPVCKARVELLSDGSGLKCVSCRRVYPVRDEIPVMLPEEAKIAEE